MFAKLSVQDLVAVAGTCRELRSAAAIVAAAKQVRKLPTTKILSEN